MTNELQAALIGLVGALIGAWIGARATYSYAEKQGKIAITLRMFEAYQQLLPKRIQADELLAKAKKDGMSLQYADLLASLGVTDWEKISHVRHFWGQLSLLKSNAQLDPILAVNLFAEDAKYWWEQYFREAEAVTKPKSRNWKETWSVLDSWLH